jgi:formylmethanofuran dehydrogenase subunit E
MWNGYDIQWIGTPEKCDECGEQYPMAWIQFVDGRFVCLACMSETE